MAWLARAGDALTDLSKLRSLQKQAPCDCCRDASEMHELGCERNQFRFVAREHVVPLAEALEKVLDEDSGDGIPEYAAAPARKALKALQEALE